MHLQVDPAQQLKTSQEASAAISPPKLLGFCWQKGAIMFSKHRISDIWYMAARLA